MSQHDETPVSITSARTSHSADIRRRQTRYLISMAIRTICFVLAVVLSGPMRWVMVTGAFVLPYFAVVVANAADGRASAGPARFADEELPQITAVSSHEPGPDRQS